MKRCFTLFLLLASACCWLTPRMAAAVTIDWVPIGNANNANDTHGAGYGGVAYDYQIAKYEVTNSQYVEFLNAKDPAGANALYLYNSSMTSNGFDSSGGIDYTAGNPNGSKYSVQSGEGNRPVTHVNWYDCIRFANWMHNGQGAGDTETGAYTLGTPHTFPAIPASGNSIARNVGALVFLPSENEWYKAAYYNGGAATYVDYATGTDVQPDSDQPPGDLSIQSNVGNFNRNDSIANGYNDGYAVTGSTSNSALQNYLTDVGAYTNAPSLYGTFDQGGNVDEWNDSVFGSAGRRSRGGHWGIPSSAMLAATREDAYNANTQGGGLGFRLATVAAVPEPSSAVLASVAAGAMVWWRRRRRK